MAGKSSISVMEIGYQNFKPGTSGNLGNYALVGGPHDSRNTNALSTNLQVIQMLAAQTKFYAWNVRHCLSYDVRRWNRNIFFQHNCPQEQQPCAHTSFRQHYSQSGTKAVFWGDVRIARLLPFPRMQPSPWQWDDIPDRTCRDPQCDR